MRTDQGALALAERVLGILEEGGFSATYKYALFTAMLDLCIEKASKHGMPPDSLTTRQIAERVVAIYWTHVTPFEGVGTLRQGGGRGQQATIVRLIQAARDQWGDPEADTLFRFRQRHATAFERLLDEVEWTLVKMPIPRLQKLGNREERFLYTYNWTEGIRRSTVSAYQRARGLCDSAGRRDQTPEFDNNLRLQPGVGELLVRLNGVLRPLFYREWAKMVARMNHLKEAQLERLLFGPERVSLEPVRAALLDIQGSRCFYCEGRISAHAEVDHFIPWKRYPDDGLDNLVVAHPKCNNSKRDFLAAAEHVESWNVRRAKHDTELAALAAEAAWHRDIDRTRSIATSIYSRLPVTARLWSAPSVFGPNERDRILAALATW